jgi:hypothetical protein
MVDYQALSKERHGGKYLKKFTDYSFAAKESICAITLQELSSAVFNFPLGFIKVDGSYTLAAMLGFHTGVNLQITKNGQWVSNYVPALFRSYPFRLLPNKQSSEQFVLCVDESSGLIVSDESDVPLFTKNGEVSDDIDLIIRNLTEVEKDRKNTQFAVSILQEHKLIEPWELTIEFKEGVHTIEGLYRISEASFNKLDSSILSELRNSGALALIYCQLLSMHNVQPLAHYAQARIKKSNVGIGGFSLDSASNDTISFENL